MKDTVFNGYLKGQPVKHFKVADNATKKPSGEFAFMIEVEKGILKDIYRCYDYKGGRTCTIGGGSSGFPAIEMGYDVVMKSKTEYFASQKSK